jgi:filamentous hemagglutinin family protein
MHISKRSSPRGVLTGLLLVAFQSGQLHANPHGGTVAQGSASFSSSGSQMTVTTSSQAFINWQSFNIGVGETTTFIQPSSSSLVWNRINDSNPSQILGTLNANGYVVLQNSSGFYVGGQAAINTHGLLMTTAPIPMPSLSGGGAWQFDALPPMAKIINFGQINIAGGAPAFLIASDIQNNGTIFNPGGKIGLYAGQKVLVSTSPDGRGINAEVTLPQGSVNNNGQLIADAGSIVMQAQVVNQGGLVQANSVKDVNGTIELMASDSLNLGASSVISAQGGADGPSAGGTVMLKSANVFSDQAGSIINIAGGAQGGAGGQVEISAAQLGGIQSDIKGAANFGFTGGKLTIDPTDLLLDSAFVSSLNSQISGGLSQINLQADHDIVISANWTLADQTSAATLDLSAGNNITLNNGSAIKAGKNWNLDFSAGTALAAGATPVSGSDGIYLNGNAVIQTVNGDINLHAANEVQVGWTGASGGQGVANSGIGRITTIGGGTITVTTEHGDVNTGGNTSGFNYLKNAPFYTPFTVNPFTGTIGTTTTLGGISTAAGGDVTIAAGGDVTSFYPTGSSGKSVATADPGTGAFGSQPGNVTINAGGNVFGHYVMMNGVGSIIAGADAGNVSQNISLSGARGSWNVNAAGNIYLQEVRNPNGIFNVQGGSSSAAYHFFDYDPMASVGLTAGDGVYLTGQNIPRPNDNVPILLPPSLSISAGSGGVTLENNMTMFPSPDGDLSIITRAGTGGDFLAENSSSLVMSDSAQTHWFVSNTSLQPFSPNDHGSTPMEMNNPDPVTISIDGNMENVILQTSKKTEITVGGDMVNSSFSGQNLHAGDVTSIHVAGDIYNSGSFNWIFLQEAIANVPLADLPPGTVNNWQTALALAVDPAKVAALTVPAGIDPAQYASYVNQLLLFGNSLQNSFAYNSSSKKLTFVGSMSSGVQTALEQPTLSVLRYDANGHPLVVNGHFVTDQINWVPANAIQALYQASQGAPSIQNSGGGLVLGGTGTLDVSARSISLGNSYGIISLGNGALLGRDYSFLTPYIQSGATIDVTVIQDVTRNGVTLPSLNMPSSTIAVLGGGDVVVNSLRGSMDLGSSELVDFESQIMKADNLGLGIYTTGGGAVNVTALGNIDIDSSRIASFNGGNIFVESYQGDVNAGSGGAVAIPINVFAPNYPHPKTPYEYVYANGIVAETLTYPAPARPPKRHKRHTHGQPPPPPPVPVLTTAPGNITVLTPQGDIIASIGGILQQSFDANAASFPSLVTLQAGTPGAGGFGSSDPPLYIGNIDVEPAGVIGINLKVEATGEIKGLIIGKNNVNVVGNVGTGLILGKTVNYSGSGPSDGPGPVIIGIDSANGSGPGQIISPDDGGHSTLAPTTATTVSQAAAQQSSSDVAQTLASKKSDDDDDEKSKKKKSQPLLKHMKRVTVILPKAI